jgi:DNA-binding HxlR family transcriptional regulator
MKSYGQFCPVAKAAELVCERWTPLILRDLVQGATRFSELQRGVPVMSPTLLARRLRQLEVEGVVERRQVQSGRSWSYHLTPAGRELAPVVEALGVWGQRWTRRQLADGEVNLGLLVWALERSVRAAAFGEARTVVQLDFVDQPSGKRRWWFVNERGHVELCLEDPGFDVGLYIACTLRDLIYIVRGDLTLSRALSTGRLDLHGPSPLRAAFADWLNLNPLARIPSERRDAVPV